jgi:hypothetical protein
MPPAYCRAVSDDSTEWQSDLRILRIHVYLIASFPTFVSFSKKKMRLCLNIFKTNVYYKIATGTQCSTGHFIPSTSLTLQLHKCVKIMQFRRYVSACTHSCNKYLYFMVLLPDQIFYIVTCRDFRHYI